MKTLSDELAELDAKVNALLPPRYQHCYAAVSPHSMGSTGLKYGDDGKVLWDRIWTTFCDLALAGGPPHRGTLLEPVPQAEVASAPERYQSVVAEISRAVELTTCLPAVDREATGWVGVRCVSRAEAAWLQFAVAAENVSVRRREHVLYLPAGPAFRVEKEVKNVVVALAKSHHYWDGHLTETQKELAVGNAWEPATPTEAAAPEHRAARAELERGLRATGLPTVPDRYAGWIGAELPAEDAAVWLLRAVLVEWVLVRREGATLYLPVGTAPNRAAEVVRAFAGAWQLWNAPGRAAGGS